VLLTRRQRHAVVVGEGYAQVFGLPSSVGAHSDIAVGTARGSGLIDGEAEGRFAGPTVVAEAAGDIERKHDAVAGGNRGHTLPHLLDDSHVLVAERDAGFGVRATFVHVQVRTADRRRGDAAVQIRGIDDTRIDEIIYW